MSNSTALILGDLQNDFLHRDGAYGRAGQTSAAIAALPEKLGPLVRVARTNGVLIVATLFTLVSGRGAEPIISRHLKMLRPFLKKGDFASGSWGQQLIEEFSPADVTVEKVAYSAFYMTRLEWVLRKWYRPALFHRHRNQWRSCIDRAGCSRTRIQLQCHRRWMRGILSARS